MKPEWKGESTGIIIGLLIIYVALGVILHFLFGYNLIGSIRILAAVTFVMLIAAILVTAFAWLLIFIISKIKRYQ